MTKRSSLVILDQSIDAGGKNVLQNKELYNC